MNILDKEDISWWAYFEYRRGNNTKEIRNLITDNRMICAYCKHVKDIKEMWKKIRDPEWAYWYCRNVKNRPEVRKYIRKINSKFMGCIIG